MQLIRLSETDIRSGYQGPPQRRGVFGARAPPLQRQRGPCRASTGLFLLFLRKKLLILNFKKHCSLKMKNKKTSKRYLSISQETS